MQGGGGINTERREGMEERWRNKVENEKVVKRKTNVVVRIGGEGD